MPELFDPYRKWLGIPAEEQPPNHYRLLGIGLYEDDRDVIVGAADRQMSHVQTKRSGKHVELTQKLLNELSAAKLCLLSQEKKTAYDDRLKQELASREPKGALASAVTAPQAISVPPVHAAPPAAPSSRETAAVPAAKAAQVTEDPVFVRKATRSVARRGRKSNNLVLIYAVSAIAAISFIGMAVVLAFVFGGSETPDPPKAVVTSDDPQPQRQVPPKQRRNVNRPPAKLNRNPIESDPPKNPFAEQEGDPESTDGPETEPIDPPSPEPTDTPDPKPNVDPPPTNEERKVVWNRSPFDGRVELGDLTASFSPHPLFSPTNEISFLEVKHAVPDAEDLQSTIELVRNIYEDEIDAARSTDEKVSLASKLVSDAAAEDAEPSAQYGMLRLAYNTVAETGEIGTCIAIVDEIGKRFEDDLVALKAGVVLAESKNLNSNVDASSISQAALGLVEQAVIHHQFDLADELCKAGLAAANQSRNTSLVDTANAFQLELPKLREQHQAYQNAMKVLQDSPENREAHFTVGKYVCFVLADWESGLPHLSVCSEEDFADVADMDLAQSEDPMEQIELGDDWIGFRESSIEIMQPAIVDRAIFWYRKAAQQLTGIKKAAVEKKIEEIGPSIEPESIDEDELAQNAELAKNLVGKYFLTLIVKSTKQTEYSVLEFRGDFDVAKNDETIGHWEVAEGKRIKLTLLSDPDSPFFFRPMSSRSSAIKTRSANGDSWTMTRLYVVSTWEHKTEGFKVFGREIPGDLETLVFYSNGRLNDPLGSVQWTLNGKNLSIAWNAAKQTVAVVSSDGKSYRGKTTTVFRKIPVNQTVTGRLLETAP